MQHVYECMQRRIEQYLALPAARIETYRPRIAKAFLTAHYLEIKLHGISHPHTTLDKGLAGGYVEQKRYNDILAIDKVFAYPNCLGNSPSKKCFYWHLCFTCGYDGLRGLCAACAWHCHKVQSEPPSPTVSFV